MKIHNSCEDGHLLLITPDREGTGTSPSLHSAEDNASYILSMEKRATTATWASSTIISSDITLVLFLQAVSPHFKLSSNTNTDLKAKFGLRCTRCWFQIKWLYSGLLFWVWREERLDASIIALGLKVWSEALSFAEQIQLYKVFWSFIIQHNILINVNMISAVWESAVRQLKVTLKQHTSWLKMYQTNH